jgi:hypothetical protein
MHAGIESEPVRTDKSLVAYNDDKTKSLRTQNPSYKKKEKGKVSPLDSTRKKYEVYTKWVSKDAEAHFLF